MEIQGKTCTWRNIQGKAERILGNTLENTLALLGRLQESYMTCKYSMVYTGHRDRGAPKKRYKDSLKKSFGSCGIDHRQWSTLASDRDAWRHTTNHAVSSFEAHRRTTLKAKRLQRKSRDTERHRDINPNQTFNCTRCNRTCLSRIGLISHERACGRRGRPT